MVVIYSHHAARCSGNGLRKGGVDEVTCGRDYARRRSQYDGTAIGAWDTHCLRGGGRGR
jgi:hypothetical protein